MSYDAWKTRSDIDDDPTCGGTEEPCNKCGQKPGKYLMTMHPSGILVCEECAQAYEEGINSDEPKAVEPRLSCGCIGTCDPFAHDTAPDWDGTPSRPSWSDLSEREQHQFLKDHPWCVDCGDDLTDEEISMCQQWCKECSERPNVLCVECGAQCAEGDLLCGHCAAANREVEDRVNEARDQ